MKFSHTAKCVLITGLVILPGCATDWVDNGSFYRATQTVLVIESSPEGQVYINGSHAGQSPFSKPLEYEREIRRKSRKVSYWISQPGLAFGITILSLGLYLPFSFIPVDVEVMQEPMPSFRGNEFVFRVQALGHREWEDKVLCRGEDKLTLKPVLLKD